MVFIRRNHDRNAAAERDSIDVLEMADGLRLQRSIHIDQRGIQADQWSHCSDDFSRLSVVGWASPTIPCQLVGNARPTSPPRNPEYLSRYSSAQHHHRQFRFSVSLPNPSATAVPLANQ